MARKDSSPLGFGVLPGTILKAIREAGLEPGQVFTQADAEPQARELEKLVGKHGVIGVDLTGSVSVEDGFSEKDVDIMLVVGLKEMGVPRAVWDEHGSWLFEIWKFPDIARRDGVPENVIKAFVGLHDAVMAALRRVDEDAEWYQNDDVVNGEPCVNGRPVPTDVFLTMHVDGR